MTAIRTLAMLVMIIGAGPAPATERGDVAPLWRALATPGHIALMRHALAPGTGDPAHFDVGDCATQRNLSAAGRSQAARIGAGFRAQGIAAARVMTSQWCRCRDTARLLGFGPVTELPALNSFFRRGERRDGQTRELESWLAEQSLDKPLVLVTHQVNITALTGVYPASGDIVVLRRRADGGLDVLGSISPDQR